MNILPAKNLAPVKPIYDLVNDQTAAPVYFLDALREIYTELMRKDLTLWREIADTSEITSNFIQGKQVWQPNYWRNGTWSIVPVNKADPNKITCINIMQFYCTAQVKMLTRSNPDIEPTEEYKGKEYKQKVKISKALWNKYERRFYTAWFNQQEAQHAIISGTYSERVYYDHLAASTQVFKELHEKKQVEISPGYSRCFEPDCGYEGSFASFTAESIPRCPNCGSYNILPPEEPITQEYMSVSGLEPIIMGDLKLELVPIQAQRFDPKYRPEESPWHITRVRMPRKQLGYILGGIEIQGDDLQLDRGLKSLENITKAGNTISGIQSASVFERFTNDDVVVDVMSIEPQYLCHIKNKKAEKTISGDVVQEGDLLTQFHNGATIIGYHGMKNFLGIYRGVSHKDEFSTGVYHMRLNSGVGRGSEDTVEVQKRFNRFDSQNVRYMEASATPARTYIEGSIDKKFVQHIGHPAAVIPVKREIAMALGSMDVVKSLVPGSTIGNFFQYTYDILNQYRQLTSHATDFTNAFPGVQNETATGAKLAKSNAESVFSPALQIKSEVRVKTAHNTLKKAKQHFAGVGQYVSFGETEARQSIGSLVKGEDIDTEIQFAVIRDSEQPKSMYDRQVDFVNMLQAANLGGGWQLIKQTDPKLAEAMLKAFDIDLKDNVYSTLVDVCENRLDQALSLQDQYKMVHQLLSEGTGMMIPELPVEMLLMGLEPSIQLEEPNHELKAKWFMDYLDTPQGYELDNDRRQVIALFVRTHFQMAVMQMAMIQQGFATAAVAGNQPMADDQENRSNAQMDKQNAREDEVAAREDAKAGQASAMQAQSEQDKAMATQDQTMLDAAMKMITNEHQAQIGGMK